MRFRASMMTSISAVILAAAFCGCTKHDRLDSPPAGSLDMAHHSPVSGPIGESVAQLQSGEDRDPCEREFAAAQLEIAQALDTRKQELENFRATETVEDSDGFKKIPLGPTFVEESVKVLSPTPGWQQYQKSWKGNIAFYNRIKNTPVDSNWIELESAVRGILSDDLDRAVNGFWFYYTIDHNGPRVLETLEPAIANCLSQSSCTSPALDEETAGLAKNNVLFAYYMKKVSDVSKSFKEKRESLQRWSAWVAIGLRGHRFRKNSTVKRHVALGYDLPLSIGQLSGAQEAIARAIESVWTRVLPAGNEMVHVQWAESGSLDGVFGFLLGDGAGSRSYVDAENRSVTLFPDVSMRSIAHEIGHVLGFKDHYYTVWNATTCQYTVQYREDDLMSYHWTGGGVTDEEWSKLLEVYGR